MSDAVAATAHEQEPQGRTPGAVARQILVIVAVVLVFSLLAAHVFGTTVSSKFSETGPDSLCTF